MQVTGAVWPPAKAPKSPCPTLKVISAVTALLDKKEEMQRGVGARALPTSREGAQRFKGGMLPRGGEEGGEGGAYEVVGHGVETAREAVIDVPASVDSGADRREQTRAHVFEEEVEGVITGSGKGLDGALLAPQSARVDAVGAEDSGFAAVPAGRAPKVVVRPKRRGALTSQ
jgi:hypothetical protein